MSGYFLFFPKKAKKLFLFSPSGRLYEYPASPAILSASECHWL
jgi:hypothetical protein